MGASLSIVVPAYQEAKRAPALVAAIRASAAADVERAGMELLEVIVVDDKKPTAVLDAPARVSFGVSFKLSGARSADLPPGKIREFRWLMIS